MQLMYTQINNDIKFDESEKFMKGEKKDIMKQFQNESDNISETISEIGIIINNNLASMLDNNIFIKQQIVLLTIVLQTLLKLILECLNFKIIVQVCFQQIQLIQMI
jgi:hypothetical protein